MTAENDTAKLNESLYDETVRFYIIDMIGLDVIDNAGADVLFRVVKHIGSHGGKCIAFGANEIVRELLHVLHTGAELAVFDSEEDALKTIGK
jgi:anti-anti-sigma regulatory factor